MAFFKAFATNPPPYVFAVIVPFFPIRAYFLIAQKSFDFLSGFGLFFYRVAGGGWHRNGVGL